MRQLTAIVLAAVVCVPCTAQRVGNIAVFGKVVDDRGQPVPNVWIKPIGIQQAEGLQTRQVQLQTRTNADGSFGLVGLPPGRYQLCAQLPSSDLLSPCRWSEKPPEITVFPGQVRRGVTIAMSRGY